MTPIQIEINSDQKIAEFKVAAAGYIKAARAAANAMDLNPTIEEAQKLADTIKELYGHLPDVPPPFSEDGELLSNLKEIDKATTWNVSMTKTEHDARRVGAQVDAGDFPKTAVTIRMLCNRIETAIVSRE